MTIRRLGNSFGRTCKPISRGIFSFTNNGESERKVDGWNTPKYTLTASMYKKG
jgi:hypothetical protein